MNDYYAMLGVPRTASAEDIKRAYRQRAFECHPDRHPNDPKAEERFKKIHVAYQALSAGGFRSTSSGFDGFDFSDFFRSRSENNTRGTRTRTREAPQEPYFYNGLLWEPRAYREQNSGSKEVFYFDESLERLRAAGYERHPRPAEAMGFLTAGLEGKLNPTEKAIFDDMFTSYGEWFSTAFEVVPNTSNKSRRGLQYLRIYTDPSLHWTGSKYEWNGIPTASQEFDVTGKELHQVIPLRDFDDALVQHLYDRPFAELPKEMQRAYIILPSLNQKWPVGRYDFSSRFSIGSFSDNRASRGVVVGQKKSIGNEGKEK